VKRIVSILLVVVLGYFVYTSLYVDGFDMAVSDNRQTSISDAYITKSVTSENESVTYMESTDLENGSANIVTAIVTDYRSFDTLGEVTVLFLASIGVSMVLAGFTKKYQFKMKTNRILKTGARLVVGLALVLGVYMFTHGHLSPGGGFPGGSIIGASILMMYLSEENFRARMASFKWMESLAGTVYVLIGIIGLFVATYFLENFLPTGTVGALVSAGIIPIVYILIGLKVGSEVSGIIDQFLTEEVAS
jgi:multicomponent Na+:H+ antiporter subunit B